jgi:hypothetical protein
LDPKPDISNTSDYREAIAHNRYDPWITQEMISKTDERRKWKNLTNEEESHRKDQ